MREFGIGVASIAGEDGMVRFLSERALAQAMAEGVDPWSPALALADEDGAALIHAAETGASALRRLVETQQSVLIVVDSEGGVIGAVTAADLFDRPTVMARPHAVGGMATPFGVYLTTGSTGAGATPWALASTGALLSLLLIVGMVLGDVASQYAFHQGWSPTLSKTIFDYLPLAVFVIGLRSMPLAGIHAAEHMTVHAIERGEPLTLEVVRRMPRVHPRCGTNLAVAASVFLGVFGTPWIADEELRLVAAALAALILRQPLGSLMQLWVTTRKPSDKQILMGIHSGKELLKRYQLAPRHSATVVQRLWSSGIFYVVAGSMAVVLVAHLCGIA